MITTNPESVVQQTNTPTPLVQVENLTRRFDNFTAVSGVSFEVFPGEIFGFLGPNGAGKSTTIKMICTLLAPTNGRIMVGGYDVRENPDEVRAAIGIVFQDNTLDSGLTALENLEFHCMMYHIPRAERPQRIKDVLHLMDLTEVKNRLVKTFSGGMRRRLEIARGLLHEPRLLILDEPTVGLDPQTRNYIWQYVRGLRDKYGTTVFMTTHYMEEAENCDRIAIIDQGKIIVLDTPAALKRLVSEDQVELVTNEPERAQNIIETAFDLPTTIEAHRLTLRVANANQFVPRLLAETTRHNLSIESLQIRLTSLEDVFIKLTGRQIRDEEGAKDERRLGQRKRGRL